MTTAPAHESSLRAVLLGCGDLGVRAGTTLTALGHHVTGVRRDVAELPEQFEGVAADLAHDALPDLPADLLVIALAPDQRDEAGYRHTYVDAMRRGVEAVLATGAPRRAVLVSSTSVYGDLTGDLDESTALDPSTGRGQVLLEAEALFHELIPHGSVLRLSGLYGTPGNRLVRQVQAGDNVDPGRWTNRMHRDDAAAAIVHLLLREEAPEPLYVGTSVDIRARVRSYFTASEQRRRMAEMVRLATEVTPIVCATTLEAGVRELRLIAEHKPRYNRRSRHPERVWWLKLTDEAFPRLSIVRSVGRDDLAYAGPFGSRGSAEEAMAALHDAVPLRQCLTRISPRRPTSACALADMGRCAAPCTGAVTVDEYAETVAEAVGVLVGDSRPAVAAVRDRMQTLSAHERFEEAAALRDRLGSLVRATSRSQRATPVREASEIIAARRAPRGGWDLVCVRHGRLAGSTHSPVGADPMPYVTALQASAEVVAPPTGPGTSALPAETELVLRWLETEGTRLVDIEGEWTCPVGGAAAAHDELAPALGWAS